MQASDYPEQARDLGQLLRSKEAATAIRMLRNALGHDKPELREAARRALATIGQEKPGLVLPELGEALQDGKRQTREAAAQVLGAMGKKASAAIPLLEEASKDFFEDVQRAAVEALKAIAA